MKSVLRNFSLLIIFFASIELSFKLKYFYDNPLHHPNDLTPSEKYFSLWSKMSDKANAKSEKQRLFLIGDSFFDAEGFGGKESYVPFFNKWLLKKNWEFFNLSLQGTSIIDHKLIWEQIYDQPNNTYVFSIKVHDINKFATYPNKNPYNSKKGFKNLIYFDFISLLKKSDLAFLIKDILHQFFMWSKHIPAPNTHLNRVLLNPSRESLQKLSHFLSDLNKKEGKVIVLINYPYNFKYHVEELNEIRLFDYFESLPYENLTLLQSPLIFNEKESVNWRNVHPNSISMEQVFIYLKKEILKSEQHSIHR